MTFPCDMVDMEMVDMDMMDMDIVGMGMVDISWSPNYSLVHLVVAKLEELISRTLLHRLHRVTIKHKNRM